MTNPLVYKHMGYRFVQSKEFPNRFVCAELQTTIVNRGDIRFTAYRPGETSGETDWFRNSVGAIRVFKTMDKCVKAVIEQWPL